jgi:hypothetical protein
MSTGNSTRSRDRLFAAILSLPVLGVGAGVAWIGLASWWMSCDDTCDDHPSSWQSDADAWQWTAQGVLALGVLLASLALTAQLVGGWRRGRRATSIGGLALLVAWFVVLTSG